MKHETHKYAAAAESFFVTTENCDQQNICHLTTMPCVQRPLYLNEMANDFSNKQVEVPKKELMVKPEMCWNHVRQPAERQQDLKQKGDPVHGKRSLS